MKGSLLILFCFVAVNWAQTQDACTPHEILDKCVNALCQNQRCNEVGKPVACAQVLKCIPGCICTFGYLRAANGTCVPIKDCEPLPCPEKEIYSRSKKDCPKLTCLDPVNKCIDGLPSKPGCICLEGSVTSSNSRICDDFICNCPKISNDISCISAFDYHMF